MSTMVLHDKTGNNWTSLGLGPIVDAINPVVTREKNGIYDLSFQYPVNGPLFQQLIVGRWIVSDAGPTSYAKAQRFEIVQISKPINGIISIYCEHYRYQLLRSVVKLNAPVTDIPAQTALNLVKSAMLPQNDFSFFSNITTKSSLDLSDPAKFKNAQEVLGGVQGSILDNYGGEYIFDNNEIRLMDRAGTQTNIVVAYGKNMTDIKQEESIENTYTSVYGWAKVGSGDDEKILVLPEIYLDSDYVANYTQRRIQMVDFSDKEPRDVGVLRNLVKSYMKNNHVGIPTVSIKTSFVDLASSVMKKELQNLEILDLCDWVTIAFNKLGINTSAQIVKTIWNVALNCYESIELGDTRTDFSKVIENAKTDVKPIEDKLNILKKAQDEASDILRHPPEGHVVIYPSLSEPQEILIMDTTNVNTARSVWRFNAGGLGFSSTGYNGTYGLAMTNNGAIVADRITTGVLKAIDIVGVAITGSTITSENGSKRVTMNNAEIRTYNGSILRSGLTPERFFVNDINGKSMLGIDQTGLSLYKESDTSNIIGSLRRMHDYDANIDEMDMAVSDNYIGALTTIRGTASYSRRLAYSSEGVFIGDLTMGTKYVSGGRSIKNARLDNTNVVGSFSVVNNVPLNFYSSLNMNGYSINNQSDIRLKENIEPTIIDGVEETKKLSFVEFDRKKDYQSKDPLKQPSTKRELGLIAQYAPFLSVEVEDDHYLRIDTSKQIMLNSLTNKQLIERLEKLEQRVSQLEEQLDRKE